MDVVIASNNAGKVREIKQILGERYTLYTMRDKGLDMDIAETGETFLANALIKAKAVCEATGCIAIADDSGLCVDALGGAPGVYSARYAGEEQNDANNRAKLLQALAAYPEEQERKAHFTTMMVLYFPDGHYIQAEGKVDGYILHEEQGDMGFGYDTLFYCYDLGKCFGMCQAEEKNSVSHRARALQALVTQL